MIKKIKRFLAKLEQFRQYEWRRVPPPMWGAKRGGRDYW